MAKEVNGKEEEEEEEEEGRIDQRREVGASCLAGHRQDESLTSLPGQDNVIFSFPVWWKVK